MRTVKKHFLKHSKSLTKAFRDKENKENKEIVKGIKKIAKSKNLTPLQLIKYFDLSFSFADSSKILIYYQMKTSILYKIKQKIFNLKKINLIKKMLLEEEKKCKQE